MLRHLQHGLPSRKSPACDRDTQSKSVIETAILTLTRQRLLSVVVSSLRLASKLAKPFEVSLSQGLQEVIVECKKRFEALKIVQKEFFFQETMRDGLVPLTGEMSGLHSFCQIRHPN
jgi:hypothetical protein